MENKTCKQCSADFVVVDEDLEFYKKMSPTFNGKVYDLPAPDFCPDCRDSRRLSFRNERSLYNRKCDKTGKQIVSIYSPDKTDYKVFEIAEWYKDDWDAMEYGRDFDFNKPFFEQFDQLMKDVPRLSLFNTNTENCEYANFVEGVKNCYMTMVTYYGTENSHFCYRTYRSKDNLDINFAEELQKCYECVFTTKSYNCRYGIRLNNCRDCAFSVDLTGCNDCFMCSNLSRKQYCIRNNQLTREEYDRQMAEYDLGSFETVEKLKNEFEQLRIDSPVKFANLTNCEDCIGDDMHDCKNVKYGFNTFESENCKYIMGEKAKNVMDSRGGGYEWCYECNHTGLGANHIMFASGVIGGYNMTYCETCHGCHDCFGCVGLRKKEYCIFNKQYTKEEYEKKVAEIIEKMQADGEWGQFFPNGTSPFGYNETIGNRLLPLTREEAIKRGFKWQEKEFDIEFSGEFYTPADNIADYADESKQKELLTAVLKCSDSGKPYRIMPQELAFYLDNKIPVPRKHFETRYGDRLKLEFVRKIHDRQCMCEEPGHGHEGRCQEKFGTTYGPDRPDKVYCEKCYQSIVK